MSEQFDVIVVGAGNGGLVAACTTAKNGLKTLLLEKHNLPGGCATSFVRGRFEFESALHELCGVGLPGERQYVYNILNDLGVEVDWRYEKNAFRVVAEGKDGFDVTVENGIENFCNSIDKAVPGSKRKVKKLFKLAEHNLQAQAYLTKKKGKPNKLVMALKYGNFMRSASHTVEEVEKAFRIPRKARNIINTYWAYLGVPTDELNAMHYINMLNMYIRYGSAMPAKRSHEISEALIKSFRDYGGQVLFNHEVTKFITDEKGSVIGVEAAGHSYYAKKVISNLMPHTAFTMIDNEKIPEEDLKLANARKIGISVETVYLGLDCTMEELGINDYTTFYVSNPNPRVQSNERGVLVVNCLNKVIPDCSPEGTCMLFFTHLCYGNDLPADLSPENYKKYKNEMADRFISQYEKALGKDIKSHIEEIVTATPVTMARYLNTPDGGIYGYEVSEWDNIMARQAHEAKEYTIPGLTFAGGHHFRGPGYCCAYFTGSFVGNRVVREFRNEAAQELLNKVKK